MASDQSKGLLLLALVISFSALSLSVNGATPCAPPIKKPPPYIPPPIKKPPPYIPPPITKPATCPIDTLKLGVCANLLGDLLGVVIGTPPKEPCCSVIQGLVDLEAAVCLCTAIKADILGINLNIPVSLSVLLNVCSKKVPPGFICP
ncbi:hypothetical protein M569_02964 [Genlisea aurea]|uniref:Bifunctional inhibitor/plant lipid transfer protein/seed storage helical domain-containing protein n=1 Tax=Genlisea aurea TaxID=192259 RepID=S8EGI5_9LAMI|nr:hypothetical protein M569_02964 [Genlisea aurea]